MVREKMILIANKHSTWVDIVMTFGCNKRTAEDLTQEMYIKIQLKIEDGLDIMYNDEINYYYIFKTLRTLFLDLKRKGKNISVVPLDHVHLTNNDVNYTDAYEKVKDELSKMYWYDRKVFEIINEGESIAEFSRKSYIQYYSLYNTYKKVKDKLKKLL
jgi:hypothetical protein|tara:strand:- start:320 stop:793 length:474 start_codon:yes stop_codon:yes gene_type:complete